MQLYFPKKLNKFQSFLNCLEDGKTWMAKNILQPYERETEVVVISPESFTWDVDILGSLLSNLQTHTRNLGLKFKVNIKPLTRSSVLKSTWALTCNQEFGGARGLSSAVGGSDRKSPAVCGGHSGDPQNSAAVAERDLNAGQSGGGKNLAITEPAHLRNWRTCRGEKNPTGLMSENRKNTRPPEHFEKS